MKSKPEIVYSPGEDAAAEMACLLRHENSTVSKPIKMSAQLAHMLVAGEAPVKDAASYKINVHAQ